MIPVQRSVSRRAALAGGTGVLALAACSPSSGDGATASPPTSGRRLAALDELTVDEAKLVVLDDGTAVIVLRTAQSSVRAFSGRCTHQGCTVKPQGPQLLCPCHLSRFNAMTGAVLHGPARLPLPPVAVAIKDGAVVTA